MAKLRVLDLFSGIGGFSLGLERTGGFETVAFCEIEEFPRRVLAKHWPGVPIYDDVRTLTAERLAADGIAVDVVCGGFPCQDLSAAGRRAGIEGERSGLWSELSRIIGELRPAYAIVENVPDLLNGERGAWFGRVLGDLAALRYDAEWHCIPAAAVGADHERDRVWIIAYPDSAGREPLYQLGWVPRQAEVGEDAASDVAGHNGARPQGRLHPRAISEDARNIGARLGPALSVADPFPREHRACSPVLGRGENGIPNRVDRMHALGNAVVPQIPELIGRAILEAAA